MLFRSFNPKIDINYWVGAHRCNPTGPVKWSATRELKLLHYKMLGVDYLYKNWMTKESRVSDENKQYGLGRRPTDKAEIAKRMKEALEMSKEIL